MPKKKKSSKSKRNHYYSRYLWKEKHRKQYTFTKTKFAVGFCTSVLFSVFMGSYFDQVGRTLLRQTWEAFVEAAADAALHEAAEEPAAEAATLPLAQSGTNDVFPTEEDNAEAEAQSSTPPRYKLFERPEEEGTESTAQVRQTVRLYP